MSKKKQYGGKGHGAYEKQKQGKGSRKGRTKEQMQKHQKRIAEKKAEKGAAMAIKAVKEAAMHTAKAVNEAANETVERLGGATQKARRSHTAKKANRPPESDYVSEREQIINGWLREFHPAAGDGGRGAV